MSTGLHWVLISTLVCLPYGRSAETLEETRGELAPPPLLPPPPSSPLLPPPPSPPLLPQPFTQPSIDFMFTRGPLPTTAPLRTPPTSTQSFLGEAATGAATIGPPLTLTRSVPSTPRIVTTPGPTLAPPTPNQIATFSVASLPVTLGDDVFPNLTLSCSADEEGQFSWQWTAPDGTPPSMVMSSNGTRTSSALFTHISADLAGLFSCQATDNALARSASHSITVDLGATLEALPIISTSDTLTLACEMYGYFPPDLPEIQWHFNNRDLTDSTTSFEVTMKEGTRYIQNGGSDVIPSVISELEVDRTLLGQYSCLISSHTAVNIENIPTTEPGSSQEETTVIIAASVAGGAMIIIIALLIIIIIVVSCQARKKKQIPPPSNVEPALYEAMSSGPVYEIPVGTKNLEIKMEKSVAYEVSTLDVNSKNNTQKSDEQEINVYDNEQEANIYDTEEEKNVYDNEQHIYQNNESHDETTHYGNAYYYQQS